MSAPLSRRGFFSALSRPFHPARSRSKAVPALKVNTPRHSNECESPAPRQGGDGLAADSAGLRNGSETGPVAARTAIIQGRFCIALTSFCSVCTERCPVPGAMIKERGLPMVVADACTGCGICQEVCPAPRNAVLLLPRRLSPSSLSA